LDANLNLLEILMVLLSFNDLTFRPSVLDGFLSYKPGPTRMVLTDLRPIFRFPPAEEKGGIKSMPASFRDFLLDSCRSGSVFIDADAGHNVITRGMGANP
jgi:hypothetical protein